MGAKIRELTQIKMTIALTRLMAILDDETKKGKYRAAEEQQRQ